MDELIRAINNLAIDRFISVAGASLWLYDYLLTFPDEFVRIWPNKWSLVKVLYLTNRYIAVPYLGLAMYYMLGMPAPSQAKTLSVPQLTPFSCRFYTIVTLIMRELELFAATWLMLLRVQALYARFRWATWVLYISFTLTHLLTAAFGAHSVAETYPTLAYLSLIRVCLSGVPTYIRFIYFIQIPFEFLLLGMQLLHYWRISRVIAPVQPTPLLQSLYAGGVLYFIATISVRLWAGFIVVFLDPTLWYMTVVIDLATTSTFISRIFLHLNEVSARSNQPSMNTTEMTATFRAKSSYIAHPTSTRYAPADSWMEMEPNRRNAKGSQHLDHA